jgi:cbb3-type cytochrome oxidase maturation protein
MALVLMGIAIWGFIWAVKSGQFDDLEGPAHRILMDDDDPKIPRLPGRASKKSESLSEKDK